MAKVMLKEVRISFPDLFEPKSFDGQQEAKYGAQFLIEKEGENYDKVIAAIKGVASEKWGKLADKTVSALTKQGKTFLNDGDDKDYPGYADMYYVTAKSKVKPKVIDRDKTDLDSTDGKPYSGSYVNAAIEIWAQDNSWGKRINCQLRGVQFYKDGEPFSGGGAASADEFDAFETEDDDDLF
jgi:hypothetical protein